MILPSTNTIIGIWGFGRVGKSAATYFHSQGYQIAIMDSDRNVSSDNFVQTHALPIFHQSEHDAFFSFCSYVLPSPGIDLQTCKKHNHQWVHELDLFYHLWQKPIIAITGSVGKTTSTSLLAQVCTYNDIPVALGGNIGTPMLNLLAQHDTTTYALLEVSSFQLENCSTFAPDIAFITNLYPNHLDRHESLDGYWHAKTRIFVNQHDGQHLIAPLSMRTQIEHYNPKAQIWYLTDTIPSSQDIDLLDDNQALVYLSHADMQLYRKSNYQTLELPKALFSSTFPLNALGIYTIAYIMNYVTNNEVKNISFDCDYVSHNHRLEYVATINNVTFINDSKATTIASTLAALDRYKETSIVLLLGGLSKGANRKELIKQLPQSVLYIACFGAEAMQLGAWCTEYGYAHGTFSTLDDAFCAAYNNATAKSTLLLSPSGSSYDLYKNYEERGDHFKQLVHNLSQ